MSIKDMRLVVTTDEGKSEIPFHEDGTTKGTVAFRLNENTIGVREIRAYVNKDAKILAEPKAPKANGKAKS